MQSPWLIAVHGGAGYHSSNPATEKAVKHAMRSACISAVDALKASSTASLSAVEHAICVLEDDECLNAGNGSNLTFDGQVECDASIMDGVTQHFGSVAALQGVRNPITVARAVLENSRKQQHLGRVPPLTLMGRGALAFARSSGLQTVEPGALITDNARREWQTWRTRLEVSQVNAPGTSSVSSKSIASPETREESDHSTLEDTVGAVACDASGGMAVGISSGGLLLKYPGRIGEATVFGAGAWASSPAGSPTGVACSVSGTGEAIIRSALARTLAAALSAASPEHAHDVIHDVLKEFCEECRKRGEDASRAGVLVAMKELVDDGGEEDEGEEEEEEEIGSDTDHVGENVREKAPWPGPTLDVHAEANASTAADETERAQPPQSQSAGPRVSARLRLWCAFSTPSMALAYTSSDDPAVKPRALILRQPASLRRTTNEDVDAGGRHLYVAALPLVRA